MFAALDRRGELSLRADEARAEAGEPAARIESGELPFELRSPALARGDAGPQQARKRVRELRRLPAAHGDASWHAGKRRPAADDVHAAAQRLHASAHGGQRAIVQSIDPVAEFVFR